MDMNALMRQAQAMQRQMMKAQRELEAKLFELDSSGGAIHISIYGSKKLESITIDKDAIDPEDKEMLETMIKVAINEALDMIDKEVEKIVISDEDYLENYKPSQLKFKSLGFIIQEGPIRSVWYNYSNIIKIEVFG